jgi:hypothetical protein
VNDASKTLSFARDADSTLKSSYKSFNLSNIPTSFNASGITTIGIDRNYLWNISYFVAFSLIGEDNMKATIDSESKVISGETVKAISADNLSDFEKYKGYNVVLKELFEIFHEEAAKKEKYAYLSLNWSQAVLQVRFDLEAPQQEITMEEANEGEGL